MNKARAPKGLATILDLHPGHVPAIVSGPSLIEPSKKLMIPRSTTVQSFLTLLRKRSLLKEDSKRARFLIINSVLPANSKSFGQLYEESGGEVLEVHVCEESTFGGFW